MGIWEQRIDDTKLHNDSGDKGKMSKYMQYNSGKGKQANISTQLTSGIMEKAKIHKHWGTGRGCTSTKQHTNANQYISK